METRLFILLDDPELHMRAQEFLFGCGIKWRGGGDTINEKHLDSNLVVLFCDGVAKYLLHTYSDIHHHTPHNPNNQQIDLRRYK